jgi:glutamate formiminotransferase
MLECVPNVSEGRDLVLIGRMADAIRSSGAALLDLHRDVDHHRSVFTTVGSARALEDAMLALMECAMRIGDLRRHRGVHPRIGIVDVIPFVPLGSDMTIDRCVQLASDVGRGIGEKLGVPVLLYGDAARSPQRRTLAAIRRGGERQLVAVLEREGPDYGPRQLHPTAGAVAVGARPPLVAFNVVLDCEDIEVARKVAGAVRASGGGLDGLRALGLALPSRRRVQVSMNLVDLRAVRVVDAYRAVERVARRLGVAVLDSEIVGLAPACSLKGATAERLRMRSDPQGLSLEGRLEEAPT